MYNAEDADAILETCRKAGAAKPEIIRQLAECCLGWPYVFGAVGELCTPQARDRRANSAYPSIKSRCQVLSGKKNSCEGCEWEGPVRMFDCRGFTYWLLKQVGIEISTVGATTQWNTTRHWDVRGEIKNLPEAVCCLFKEKDGKMNHTGMYLGDGHIIHCSTTVKHDKLPGSPAWTHFAIPKGLYTTAELAELTAALPARPTLRRGDVGDAVRHMQQLLTAAGYDVGYSGADGIFGTNTESAVLAFQADRRLAVDGVCGPRTWAALDTQGQPASTYTVHIPGMDKDTAEGFVKAYHGAWITREDAK